MTIVSKRTNFWSVCEKTGSMKQASLGSPYDRPASAILRFLVEVIAWVAGPWAAAEVHIVLAVPVLLVLLALPSVFSTPGDKHQVIVATPGAIRLGIEALLIAVAAAAPWVIWPTWAAGPATVIVAGAVVFGLPRSLWLLRGAPTLKD